MNREPTITSRRVYDGHVVSLRVDTVLLDDGETTQREIVEHRGSVAIVPLDADEHVLMVRQYRKPAERELLEIPAGTLEPGESPDDCAARELEEEVGHVAGCLVHLGQFYTSPGFSTEVIHLYLATELRPTTMHTEGDEFITVERLPLEEALRMVHQGQICDAKSIVGLLKTGTLRSTQ